MTKAVCYLIVVLGADWADSIFDGKSSSKWSSKWSSGKRNSRKWSRGKGGSSSKGASGKWSASSVSLESSRVGVKR